MKHFCLALLACLMLAFPAMAADAPPAKPKEPDISHLSPEKRERLAQLKAALQQAEDQVRAIVNQPVTRVERTRSSHPVVYSPGWFHEGANRPAYATIDVRTTQDFPYNVKGSRYVSSDLNPTEMFLASELEFNANTKFYYTDLTLPKKKLTEPEMLHINELYRYIGQRRNDIRLIENPDFMEVVHEGEWVTSPFFYVPVLLLWGLGMWLLYRGWRMKRGA